MRREAYTNVVVFLSVLAALAFSIGYTNFVDRQSARKFCNVVVVVSDAYRQTPPSTQLGVEIAKDYEQLRKDLGCD